MATAGHAGPRGATTARSSTRRDKTWFSKLRECEDTSAGTRTAASSGRIPTWPRGFPPGGPVLSTSSRPRSGVPSTGLQRSSRPRRPGPFGPGSKEAHLSRAAGTETAARANRGAGGRAAGAQRKSRGAGFLQRVRRGNQADARPSGIGARAAAPGLCAVGRARFEERLATGGGLTRPVLQLPATIKVMISVSACPAVGRKYLRDVTTILRRAR